MLQLGLVIKEKSMFIRKRKNISDPNGRQDLAERAKVVSRMIKVMRKPGYDIFILMI